MTRENTAYSMIAVLAILIGGLVILIRSYQSDLRRYYYNRVCKGFVEETVREMVKPAALTGSINFSPCITFGDGSRRCEKENDLR